jgi:anti-sigma regulatory factor (Ser/Thr protein kinase)
MATAEGPPRRQLEHAALLYAGLDDLLGSMVPMVTAALDQQEFVFVAARPDNLAALRAELGERAGAVGWADTRQWHPHPATRLRAFHELVTDRLGAGATGLRLAGEPPWPAGPPERVREWQRYESALNAVLAPFPVTLLCLYDTSGLDASVVDAARRTHPTVHQDGAPRPSGRFEPPARFLRRWNAALPPPPPLAARMPEFSDLSAARRFLHDQALRAGVRPERMGDLLVAANEVLTNALVHGNSAASLWAWADDGHFVCQVEDGGGGIADPLAGYRPPSLDASMGRGLWLVRQLVDLLQIEPGPPGTRVRLHVRQR